MVGVLSPFSLYSAVGRKRRKSGTTPYLHIKKAIQRTCLCKRRGRPRVPTNDEKNSEIRALINLLSGTMVSVVVEGSSDEVFVGLSSLNHGLSEAAREFKVLSFPPPVNVRINQVGQMIELRRHLNIRRRIQIHRVAYNILEKIRIRFKYVL